MPYRAHRDGAMNRRGTGVAAAPNQSLTPDDSATAGPVPVER
jgi:hypothetical protein